VQSLPARGFFAEHTHPWHQFVYASTGVLTVTAAGQCFVIAPQQAVWVPAGLPHRTGSLLGAEFRSLYVAPEALPGPQGRCALLAVTPFLRALILEAGSLLARGAQRPGCPAPVRADPLAPGPPAAAAGGLALAGFTRPGAAVRGALCRPGRPA
jgi:hypothetical protein